MSGVALPSTCFDASGKLRPPPWDVFGTQVGIVRCNEKKTVTILVLEGCMRTMTDDQIVNLLTMIEELATAFRRIVPAGWTVLT